MGYGPVTKLLHKTTVSCEFPWTYSLVKGTYTSTNCEFMQFICVAHIPFRFKCKFGIMGLRVWHPGLINASLEAWLSVREAPLDTGIYINRGMLRDPMDAELFPQALLADLGAGGTLTGALLMGKGTLAGVETPVFGFAPVPGLADILSALAGALLMGKGTLARVETPVFGLARFLGWLAFYPLVRCGQSSPNPLTN